MISHTSDFNIVEIAGSSVGAKGYKTNDTKFILVNINGIFDKNYKECLKMILLICYYAYLDNAQ